VLANNNKSVTYLFFIQFFIGDKKSDKKITECYELKILIKSLLGLYVTLQIGHLFIACPQISQQQK
jgi:hypothetical protein